MYPSIRQSRGDILAGFMRELRFGVRQLINSPGFTVGKQTRSGGEERRVGVIQRRDPTLPYRV